MTRSLRLAAILTVVAGVLAAQAAAGDRLILISCDGLRADAITDATAPRMRELMSSGVSAREALCDLPSITLPNHTSMLTGLTAKRHGVLANTDLPGKVQFETLLDFAHDAGLRTAFFVSKSKLLYLAHPESIETTVYESDTVSLVDQMLPLIADNGPDVFFLHIRDPDSAGHRYQWMSPEYLDAVSATDTLIGRVVDKVNEGDRPTYILVTADHGGEGLSHVANVPVVRHIPWIVVGPRIPAGAILDETVSTTDTTPTALFLLGVDVPPDLSGVARTEVFEPSDTQSALSVPMVGPPCVVFMALGLAVIGAACWVWSKPGDSRARSTPVQDRAPEK